MVSSSELRSRVADSSRCAYACGVRTSVSVALVAAIARRVAVEGAHLFVAAVGDRRHHGLGAADRGDGDTAAERLGQTHHVGHHPAACGDSAWAR